MIHAFSSYDVRHVNYTGHLSPRWYSEKCSIIHIITTGYEVIGNFPTRSRNVIRRRSNMHLMHAHAQTAITRIGITKEDYIILSYVLCAKPRATVNESHPEDDQFLFIFPGLLYSAHGRCTWKVKTAAGPPMRWYKLTCCCARVQVLHYYRRGRRTLWHKRLRKNKGSKEFKTN